MNMPDTTNLSIRIDRSLKDEADQMFNEMGMNLTTAITIFIRQAVRQKKIPFEIALDASYNKGILKPYVQREAEPRGREAF